MKRGTWLQSVLLSAMQQATLDPETRGSVTAAERSRAHVELAPYSGSANAMISSFVGRDPVRPPPVLTIVTYWRPSAPR